MLARTFLRAADGRLRVGIYYSSWLIEQLEKHDPRSGLSDANINALIAFVEEINHALHAALQFQRGEAPNHDEAYARNLELQAQVDTYLVLLLFVAFFRSPGRLPARIAGGCAFTCLNRDTGRSFRDRTISARYAETTLLAKSYTRYLESLAASRRVEEIRIFHALEYDRKRARILALRKGKRERDGCRVERARGCNSRHRLA